MAGREVYVDGERVELTPKEYELLLTIYPPALLDVQWHESSSAHKFLTYIISHLRNFCNSFYKCCNKKILLNIAISEDSIAGI